MSTLNIVPVARIKRMKDLGMWFFTKKTENYIQGMSYVLIDPKTGEKTGEFIPFEGIHLNNGFKGKILVLRAKNADS